MEDFSTLLLGPTGCGKGAAAAAIGRSGYIPFDQKKQSFAESFTKTVISINLSQFPETLLESELFGHTKGAFTGAVGGHDGLFAMCGPHGSIFLDEIGELSGQVQISTKNPTKHYFFLNPYKDCAFTKCPKCNKNTKLRKFPLVIHIEPNQFVVLNKNCKYCTDCDLIIVKQSKIESLMSYQFEKVDPSIVGNKYLVFGTLSRKDWQKYSKTPTNPGEAIDQVYVFKDVWSFEVRKWCESDEVKSR